MSYSPSPHSLDGGYSPSPWLANTNNIPTHLLRPSHHPHQYHHTPLSSSHSADYLSTSASALSSSMRLQHKLNSDARSTVVLSQYRYAGGYELGPVIGVGTYGEVRYGRSIDGTNRDEDDEPSEHSAGKPTAQFPTLLPGASVAIKLIDLARFTDDTAVLMRKEILILQLLHHRHVIKLFDVKEDVAYTGEWCDHCACTQYKRSSQQPGVCVHCSHPGSEHTREETRPVMMIVQELAIAGELFGLLMHTGPLAEDMARYYFRQMIEGLEYMHNSGVVHRDLKPENLVMDHHYQLKIIDFGLSALESALPPSEDSGDQQQQQHSGDSYSADAIPRSRSMSITSLSSLSRQRSHSRSSHQPADSDSSLLTSHPFQYSGVGSCPYSAPEVYYISSLYNNRPYRGASADVWSAAIILFVMLLGRPPFMRPLAKTYGSNMRRCRHFVSVMKGEGYGGMSGGARDLLMKMMRMAPGERLPLKEIKEDAWYQGPVPGEDEVRRVIEERSKEVYRKLDKSEMIALMETVRKEEIQHKQMMEEMERDKQQHDMSQHDDRPSAPHTPSSTSRSHRDVFPSTSPSSRSRSSASHPAFSFVNTSSPLFLSTPRTSDGYPSDHLTVSMLSLNDEAQAGGGGAAGVLQPRALPYSHSSLSDGPSSASISATSSSPSPPPSASTMSPNYWQYR